MKRHKRSTDLIEEDSSQEDLPPLFQDVSFYLSKFLNAFLRSRKHLWLNFSILDSIFELQLNDDYQKLQYVSKWHLLLQVFKFKKKST